ncbi:MAG: ATP-binding protein [Clostridia bacterium]|nr:ATP-binding protein [Clostridia bacterium]
MDTANVIRQLLGEYEQQREENYREEQRRKREAGGVDPEILDLINERMFVFRDAQRVAFANGSVDTQAMQAQLVALSTRIREKLVNAGFPEDYLQPIYRCPVCQDTGYVGELIREKCNCLKQRIMDAENASERKGGLGSHRFEQFDLNVFPDEPVKGEKATQREHMRRIERAARRYAEDFPDTQKPNLVFFGASGLGKTFVADCIASRVMDRAFVVRRVTAYRLMELMRKFQFDGSEAQAVDYLQTCDLLFIDDLGTEPQTKSTSSYLFQIINERNNNDLHTIISTNLSPEQIFDLYSERVASRLMDVSKTTTIRFYGRDLRMTRRN